MGDGRAEADVDPGVGRAQHVLVRSEEEPAGGHGPDGQEDEFGPGERVGGEWQVASGGWRVAVSARRSAVGFDSPQVKGHERADQQQPDQRQPPHGEEAHLGQQQRRPAQHGQPQRQRGEGQR